MYELSFYLNGENNNNDVFKATFFLSEKNNQLVLEICEISVVHIQCKQLIEYS